MKPTSWAFSLRVILSGSNHSHWGSPGNRTLRSPRKCYIFEIFNLLHDCGKCWMGNTTEMWMIRHLLKQKPWTNGEGSVSLTS